MNDFKKGLLVGIVIMSSIFLFIASTKSDVGSNDRREIVEYYMTMSSDFATLNGIINNRIYQNWQPFGSPFISDSPSATYYYQAMVKYKED
jgi:hypothetical protein